MWYRTQSLVGSCPAVRRIFPGEKDLTRRTTVDVAIPADNFFLARMLKASQTWMQGHIAHSAHALVENIVSRWSTQLPASLIVVVLIRLEMCTAKSKDRMQASKLNQTLTQTWRVVLRRCQLLCHFDNSHSWAEQCPLPQLCGFPWRHKTALQP